MNFTRSAELHARSSRVLACGVSSGMRKSVTDPPLFFERAEGPYYVDVDGNRLLDYTLAWGPLILGSNHPALNNAVRVALETSYTLGAQHPGEIALAEKIVDLVPGAEQVIFSNTGSEAVQAALRLARATTGRNAFIKFEGHYHGWMNNVLLSYHDAPDAMGPLDAPNVLPACGGQPESEYADTRVLPWNRLDLLERELAKGDIAAVITEPVNANSGTIMPGDGYLAGLIDLCRKHGAVSIFDEVITGFRLALGGAREYFDLVPDLSVYAKALAAGFSLAAVAGRASLFDALRDGRTIHAGTYNGATVNLAAASAVLDTLASDPANYDRMHAHGQALREHIEAEGRRAGRTLCTSGTGTVFSVHLGLDTPPTHYREWTAADMATYTRFREAMLHRGIQLLPDARWYVGLAHGDAELNRAREAVSGAFADIA